MHVVIVAHGQSVGATSARVAEALAGGWREGAPGVRVEARVATDAGPVAAAVLATLPGARSVGGRWPGGGGRFNAVELKGRTAFLQADTLVEDGEGSSGPVAAAVATLAQQGVRRIVLGLGVPRVWDGGADLLEAVAANPWPASLEIVGAYAVPLVLDGAGGIVARALADGRLDHAGAQVAERALADLARTRGAASGIGGDLLIPPARRPGVGAGGGVGFALAVLGYPLRPGAEVLAEATGLLTDLADADLVVEATPLVEWTNREQGVGAVLARAAAARAVPLVVLAGESRLVRREWAEAGIAGLYEIGELSQAPASEPGTDWAAALAARTERLAHTWTPTAPGAASPATPGRG